MKEFINYIIRELRVSNSEFKVLSLVFYFFHIFSTEFFGVVLLKIEILERKIYIPEESI
jgi:hypothetical protein